MARRNQLSDEENEPHEVTREELIAELKRLIGWSEEQIAADPALRHERFWFYPSVNAWAPIQDL